MGTKSPMSFTASTTLAIAGVSLYLRILVERMRGCNIKYAVVVVPRNSRPTVVNQVIINGDDLNITTCEVSEIADLPDTVSSLMNDALQKGKITADGSNVRIFRMEIAVGDFAFPRFHLVNNKLEPVGSDWFPQYPLPTA